MSKTRREKAMEQRHDPIQKEFIYRVKNKTPNQLTVASEYDSIDSVLHKVKLDLMTLTNYPEMIDSKIEITFSLKPTDGFTDHRHGSDK